jgi:hypothetical protein
MEIIGSQKKTCLEKRGHWIAVLLIVESQVTVLKLEHVNFKDGKVRSMFCSHIMPTWGCIHHIRRWLLEVTFAKVYGKNVHVISF